ncbi:MAG: histidine ammonia-lyase [Bacteroidota bacterium]|jgi:phenylalanine and histidine ammonia-lyase
MNLDKFYSVVFGNDKVEVSAEDMQTVAGSYEFLERFAAKKLIYGINTGFGPMAQYRIDEASMRQLQINLIRSHCTGVGQILSAEETKAVMLTRLNTFLQGYSGVHTDTIELLQVLINNNITPVIYEHGSVGASGDLVQLAHLALCLVGEGEVMVDGCRRKTEDVFGQMGIKPLRIHLREGLALTNGTSVMTAIGLINVLRAKRLIELSVTLSSMINEVVGAFDDHFSEELNMAKRHKGQREIARTMRYILATSRCIRKRENYFYNQEIKDNFIEHKVQEYYSLRCVPQILGAIADEADNAERVLLDELNSASDNPIIDVKTGNVYHGGNFHGDYVAFEMDKLKTGITKLTMLAERQLNYLCHNKLNGILPPFVNLGVLGLNYGVQAAQFTATSTTAECQTLSMPMYVHSIPNNNDNQDIVSMGTNAALITKRVIENSFQVLAIEAIAMVQAVDYLQIADLLSVKTRQLYDRVRRIVPLFVEDNPLYGAIEELVEELKKK